MCVCLCNCSCRKEECIQLELFVWSARVKVKPKLADKVNFSTLCIGPVSKFVSGRRKEKIYPGKAIDTTHVHRLYFALLPSFLSGGNLCVFNVRSDIYDAKVEQIKRLIQIGRIMKCSERTTRLLKRWVGKGEVNLIYKLNRGQFIVSFVNLYLWPVKRC